MSMEQKGPKTIDEYIAGFPQDVQKRLEQVRRAIRAAAPDAQEAIKYTIPTFTLNGNLMSFAAYKSHLSLYPAPAGTQKFQRVLAPYKAAKSTVRFPLDKPLPLDLVHEIAKYRVKEHLASVKAKAKAKK